MSTKSRLYGGAGMAALLLAPGLVLFVLFTLWPALDALYVSCCSWEGFSPEKTFTGIENYVRLAEDPRFRAALGNTFFYVLLGGLGHFFFAFLFACALNHPRWAGKKLYQTLIFFPSFISVAGVAILWARLYDPTGGLLNRLLEACGFLPVTWLNERNAMYAIVLASVWAGVGGQMILLLAGMRRIPPSYYEAARIDGAGEFQLFRHVTLPLLKDVAYVALSLWLIGSMQVFGLIQALSPDEIPIEQETVATYQYAISFNARDNIYLMGRGTAMAVVLAALILLLVALTRMLFGKRELEY